jgi:taurine dioxygenase
MPQIQIEPLSSALSFGCTVHGLNSGNVTDESVRQAIRQAFERDGLIVFKEMERSDEMQMAVSGIIGPPQDYAFSGKIEIDPEASRGLVEFNYEGNIVEADGKPIVGWVPWHFDACYSDKLNRGGVLRALEMPPEGGMTGFADGIQLYASISPKLRARFEDLCILYHHAHATFHNQRFGVPDGYQWVSLSDKVRGLFESKKDEPRSVHPAIWQRKTGERVLHVSPWQATGVYGREDADGDAMLEELCAEMYAKMDDYWHQWEPTDMVAWDNWRFIHSAGGNDPKYPRLVRRTTIAGDYGLGCWEADLQPRNTPRERSPSLPQA